MTIWLSWCQIESKKKYIKFLFYYWDGKSLKVLVEYNLYLFGGRWLECNTNCWMTIWSSRSQMEVCNDNMLYIHLVYGVRWKCVMILCWMFIWCMVHQGALDNDCHSPDQWSPFQPHSSYLPGWSHCAQCVVCSVYCAVYIVCCTLYSVKLTVVSVKCTV